MSHSDTLTPPAHVQRQSQGQSQPHPAGDSSGELLPGLRPRNGFTFREGQLAFLTKLAAALARGEENHLGVFVPGYGKTITALSSFLVAYNLGVARKLVVFVPRGNLRDQYADPKELNRVFQNLGAPELSFCVADSERVFLKNLDTSIIITTYQYASGRGGHGALLKYCQSAPCMFVFDEVHHLSDDGLWASKIGQFPFACSVSLSGTPMRSDNRTLFGVPFHMAANGEQYYEALHEVTMRDAHAEGKILKRVKAHVVDYRLTMVRSDTGQMVEMSLSQLADMARTKNDVDAFLARKKLRFHDVYLDSLLRPAFVRFAEKRRAHAEDAGLRRGRNHQMLIIAMSNRHAAAILEFVKLHFTEFSSARIGQDIPAAERQELLDRYRSGGIDVMVQVDMIGEGTDIKPISVIVKADLVRAYSKTMQQVFRGMRYYDGFSEKANLCDIYSANDSEVVRTLEWITSEEQLGVKLREERQRVDALARSGPQVSMWELRQVEHRDMQTHSLELFPEYARPLETEPHAAQATAAVVDVSRREQELRQECANLASRLSFQLKSTGRIIEVSTIHAEAKRRFAKAQGDLSLNELTRKRDWLIRCIDARKLL
ncbi:MAG: DEAD/DEAH box helicase family protein [Bacteroidetes bacterium]|nr:DEAD/DEAH box helicase family protein [Bacteroidota bacterium]